VRADLLEWRRARAPLDLDNGAEGDSILFILDALKNHRGAHLHGQEIACREPKPVEAEVRECMAACTYCGHELGWWQALWGPAYHIECQQRAVAKQEAERREAERARLAREQAQIEANSRARRETIEALQHAAETGDFSQMRATPVMLLDPDEICFCVIHGCRKASYFPQVDGSGRGGFTADGVIRPDGLLPKEAGALHISSKRICFASKVGAVNLLLKKINLCTSEGDALCLNMEGRVNASHFILDPDIATAVAAAVQTLAAQVKQSAKTDRKRPADNAA